MSCRCDAGQVGTGDGWDIRRFCRFLPSLTAGLARAGGRAQRDLDLTTEASKGGFVMWMQLSPNGVSTINIPVGETFVLTFTGNPRFQPVHFWAEPVNQGGNV